MAGNEWINGYLEAILDGRTNDTSNDGGQLVEEDVESGSVSQGLTFNPARYFIDEVVNGTDEIDLHHFWVKVTATKNTEERNRRLENLCWRIWHLSRTTKKADWEQKKRTQKRRMERERGRRDVVEDLSEDLSEGEKFGVDGSCHGGSGMKLSESHFNLELLGDQQQQQKEKRLYIVMISLHGLVRGWNMELGRDSDTGGQVKYAVEFAKALAQMPEVYRVDLLTRQICSLEVDSSYGEPTEMLTSEVDEEIGEAGGAYIIRIPCGDKEKYYEKENLWPYIPEFVDGALGHILNISKVLGDLIGGGSAVWPHVIHGHYADAGYAACLLSGALNVPMVLTGHSLGRNKLEQILKQGKQSKEEINKTYKIYRRIDAEELCLDSAELVVTSTRQEIEEQWGLYDGFDLELDRKLRARAKRGQNCYGLYMPRMAVIPPGMDFSNVIVQGDSTEEDLENDPGQLSDSPLWGETLRFLNNTSKPIILALARPDPKKNIATLVKAFGECNKLRKLANLMLIMGNRDDIDQMPAASANLLTTVLKLIDKYDLYGEVAYPKHHKQSDVGDIYRIAAKTKGVFINPALVEPFGLTLIEAAAHGLPMVATKNGGPVDIHRTLQNGLLIDPHDDKAIASALYRLVADKNLWSECRQNGLRNINLYSWPQHCKIYFVRVSQCRMRHPQWQSDPVESAESESETDSFKDVQDISLRLSLDLDNRSSSFNSSDRLGQDDGISDHIRKAIERAKGRPSNSQERNDENGREKQSLDHSNSLNSSGKLLLRRRKHLFVIAVDCYDSNGESCAQKQVNIIQEIINAIRFVHTSASFGFVLSTSMTVTETLSLLQFGAINLSTFDALICSSGSELFYVSGDNVDSPIFPDPDYDSHIDYRWENAAGLRKHMLKLSGPKDSPFFEQDALASNSHCLAYKVKNLSTAPKADALRKELRMRGARCHVIYCQNCSRLRILPLHASRSQALRYLYVRWGLDIANMCVLVGERGDTDYEELIPGMHKTIILRNVVSSGSEKMGRSPNSYGREDVVPLQSPNILTVTVSEDYEGLKSQELIASIKRLV
ncbi:hypothetical protein SUGI_1197410 [Cryptomeria japonica]|uniref:probable sucrose-phosphate synthase 2 n=1 Tax=Cryptomeria japonica TaxID=3369 RepID=UPI0024148E50|nr:probable sucrose-phosphate synthase 2 [Cryptomeria japonica]GLJ55759.1 hypothetical protein SUGI_1197410 [Cryptomeria japonica]